MTKNGKRPLDTKGQVLLYHSHSAAPSQGAFFIPPSKTPGTQHLYIAPDFSPSIQPRQLKRYDGRFQYRQ